MSLGPLEPVRDYYNKVERSYRQQLDRTAPHVLHRWLATAGVLCLFMLRIVLAQGVSYLAFLLYLWFSFTFAAVVHWYVYIPLKECFLIQFNTARTL